MPMLQSLEIWAGYDGADEDVDYHHDLPLVPALWQLTRLTRLVLDPVAVQSDKRAGGGTDASVSKDVPVASISEGLGNLTGLSELRLTGQWLALPASFSRLTALRSLILGVDAAHTMPSARVRLCSRQRFSGQLAARP